MKNKIKILCAPADAAGATLPAKTSTPPDLNLGTEGIGDALQHLELPAGVGDAFKDDKSKVQSPKSKVEAAEKTPPGGGTPNARTEEPAWTADQLAWFELRNKATTPEEIAAAEEQVPEFSAEESAWLEKQDDADGPQTAATKPELPPEAEAWVKENLETPLATAKAAAEAASKRADAAEAKVAEISNLPPPVAGDLHPLALADKPEQIDGYEQDLEKFIAWGKENWDGTAEVKDAEGKVTQPAYSAAEIRKSVAARETELRKVVPAARAALKQRQDNAQFAATLYPDLFDGKKPEGQAVSALFRQYPFLKTVPQIEVIAGDSFVGYKLRGILADPKHKNFAAATALVNTLPELKAFLKLSAPATAAKAARPLPPKISPKPNAGNGRSPVIPARKADKVPNVDKFVKAKAGAGSEIDALAQVLGD